jgi:type VI secretion system protein ImpH
MAAPPATDHPSGQTAWLDRLTSAGWTFDFFQAVWLLERFVGGRVPVGDRGPVEHELLRFRPDVSLGFPATDVHGITQLGAYGDDAPTYRVEVSFLGLYGVSTPLPLHYAVDILRGVGQAEAPSRGSIDEGAPSAPPLPEPTIGSTPVRDFLDIFHHRLISLFYRSWLKYRYDRSFGMPGRDAITDYLLWLIGGAPGLGRTELGVEPLRLVRYAGLLTQRPHSAVMLEGMLRDYWKELGVEVQQGVGRWVPVPAADQNQIGVANSRLGMDLTVGEELFDLSGTFNVVLGPMTWNEYLSFLPDGLRFHETRSLVRYYCADPLAFTFDLHIRANEIPETQLTSDGQAGRLGYTSWVRTGEKAETSVTFDACRLTGPPPESVEDAARGRAA